MVGERGARERYGGVVCVRVWATGVVVEVELRGKQVVCFFFFNDTATTEIYTLSLHDALPISQSCWGHSCAGFRRVLLFAVSDVSGIHAPAIPILRSEEHTSELQSRRNLVCRLLLEKKKNALLLPPPPSP